MRCVGWSFAVTGIAVAALAATRVGSDHASLQLLGGGLGAALGLAGTFLGFHRRGAPHAPGGANPAAPLVPRYFQERRLSPRHDLEVPVRVSVNGRSFTAKLLNVGSGGALLRVPTEHATSLQDQVGSPVSIHDYPAGSLTRVGSHGMYVDFAVAFEPSAANASFESVRSAS
jgi:hypothetical protein